MERAALILSIARDELSRSGVCVPAHIADLAAARGAWAGETERLERQAQLAEVRRALKAWREEGRRVLVAIRQDIFGESQCVYREAGRAAADRAPRGREWFLARITGLVADGIREGSLTAEDAAAIAQAMAAVRAR